MSFVRNLLLAAGAALMVPAAAFADTYTMANFSGAIFPGNANVQSPFSGNGFTQGDPLSGHLVFDNDQVPAAGSGFDNVFYNGFPDIAGIPNADAFSLTLDGLSFDLGGNIDALLPAAIQYNNGQFNGFVYNADFNFQGAFYQFELQGSTFSVFALDGVGDSFDPHGEPTGQRLIGGFINTGNGNLTDQTPFTPVTMPGVPEPATWAMMLIGFGGLGAAMRTSRRKGALAAA